MPHQSPEKIKFLALMLAGTIIAAMAYQDEKYGAQQLYDNKLLYPASTFENLIALANSMAMSNSLLAIGSKALIEKSIPFSREMYERFLPALNAIPELDEIFAEYFNPQSLRSSLQA